jgi:IS30 family transposase
MWRWLNLCALSDGNLSHYPRYRITYCAVSVLAAQLLQSLTWVRVKELSDQVRLTIESGMKVFLADPHSLWLRSTNENTNGLQRR